jgi:hypothetical protein
MLSRLVCNGSVLAKSPRKHGTRTQSGRGPDCASHLSLQSSRLAGPYIQVFREPGCSKRLVEEPIDIAQDQAAIHLAQFFIKRDELAEDNACEMADIAEIHVEICLAAFQGQLEKLIGQNPNGFRVELALAERYQNPVVNVFHFPVVREKLKCHDGNSLSET